MEIGEQLASAIRNFGESCEGVGLTKGLALGRQAERAAVLEMVRKADSSVSLGPVCAAFERDHIAAVPYQVEHGWNLACEYLARAIEARGKE